jgi:hypothetical protein
VEYGLSVGLPSVEDIADYGAHLHMARFQESILSGCRLVTQGGRSHFVPERREFGKGRSLRQQESINGAEEVPSHGRRVLCTHMGNLHFRQYLYKSHFVVHTDHKPLEWLATVLDAHGW